MNNSIENLLREMMAVQSDTGTEKECGMEKYIHHVLCVDSYFNEHPEFVGLYGHDDIYNRHVVWAFKDNKACDTIVLAGHYDAVSIDNYGELKPYALNPEELREKLMDLELDELSKQDIGNDNWLWGRGSCDMKAGLAINLHAILTNTSKKHNILFIAVPDEENLSYGMRCAVGLLSDLKHKYNLKYKLLVLTEPHGRNEDDTFKIHYGSVGKIMPTIFVKGKLSHVSAILQGLNPLPLLNHIVNAMDLNTELCFKDKGVSTMPPTVLGVTDLRQGYDVSIPEFSAAYFNMNFLKNIPMEQVFNKIMTLCKKSVEQYMEKLKTVNETMGIGKDEFEFNHIEVLGYDEFKIKYVDTMEQSNEIVKEIYKEVESKVSSKEMNLQQGSIYLLSRLVKASNINHPVVIVGAIPPYYPAVNNDYMVDGNLELGKDMENVMENIEHVLKACGLKLEKEPYFMGISDLSYVSCTDAISELKVMDNLIVSPSLYNINFKAISKLNIPAINIGPWGRDLHQNTERVYMPDVVKNIPEILKKIM